MSDLWEHDMYINENDPYLFNTDIIEYDMKDAGFSLIKEFKILDKKTITRLEKLDKQRRHITIGVMEKDNKDLREGKKEAFKLARKFFFEANGLEKGDIVSIKKDAIFTRKICTQQRFGDYINFRPKNNYSSYINIGKNMEFYYNPTQLDVKGLSDDNYKLHKDFMLKFVNQFISKMETEDPDTVIGFTKRFIDKYKWRKVDIGYYRTLDHRSMFMMNDDSGELYENYFEEDKWDIDITYNYFTVLLKLIQIPI